MTIIKIQTYLQHKIEINDITKTSNQNKIKKQNQTTP